MSWDEQLSSVLLSSCPVHRVWVRCHVVQEVLSVLEVPVAMVSIAMLPGCHGDCHGAEAPTTYRFVARSKLSTLIFRLN